MCMTAVTHFVRTHEPDMPEQAVLPTDWAEADTRVARHTPMAVSQGVSIEEAQNTTLCGLY